MIAVPVTQVWIYTGCLFLACVILVSATWEYPPRFIASSNKGFSTDRRARVELVAKNWSGGCAWLLAMQCIDTFEFSLAHLVLGRGHWHPWGNPAVRQSYLAVWLHTLLLQHHAHFLLHCWPFAGRARSVQQRNFFEQLVAVAPFRCCLSGDERCTCGNGH